MAVRASRFLLGSALEDHAPVSFTKAVITTDVAIQVATRHAPTTAETDVDNALDRVAKGLRELQGPEEARNACHVSRGFASAEFARLVEGAVKAKLEAEVAGLIRARPPAEFLKTK